MNVGFTDLWNRMFLFIGPFWAILAWMIWSSGQLQTAQDRSIYLLVVIPGFIAVYFSGFLIESWHKKKQGKAGS